MSITIMQNDPGDHSPANDQHIVLDMEVQAETFPDFEPEGFVALCGKRLGREFLDCVNPRELSTHGIPTIPLCTACLKALCFAAELGWTTAASVFNSEFDIINSIAHRIDMAEPAPDAPALDPAFPSHTVANPPPIRSLPVVMSAVSAANLKKLTDAGTIDVPEDGSAAGDLMRRALQRKDTKE